MPTFNFLLEAQDGSGHFRRGQIEVTEQDCADWEMDDPKKVAKLILEERERRNAAFQMSEDQVDDLLKANPGAKSLDDLPPPGKPDASEEEKAPHREIYAGEDGTRRAHLNLHRQEKPYKLAKLEEVK